MWMKAIQPKMFFFPGEDFKNMNPISFLDVELLVSSLFVSFNIF